MNGIRNTYLYVCGSQRLLDIRHIYTSAGLIGLSCFITIYNILIFIKGHLTGTVTCILPNGKSFTLIDIGLNEQFCYVRSGLHRRTNHRRSQRTVIATGTNPFLLQCFKGTMKWLNVSPTMHYLNIVHIHIDHTELMSYFSPSASPFQTRDTWTTPSCQTSSLWSRATSSTLTRSFWWTRLIGSGRCSPTSSQRAVNPSLRSTTFAIRYFR